MRYSILIALLVMFGACKKEKTAEPKLTATLTSEGHTRAGVFGVVEDRLLERRVSRLVREFALGHGVRRYTTDAVDRRSANVSRTTEVTRRCTISPRSSIWAFAPSA
jgi:hypothetical protein